MGKRVGYRKRRSYRKARSNKLRRYNYIKDKAAAVRLEYAMPVYMNTTAGLISYYSFAPTTGGTAILATEVFSGNSNATSTYPEFAAYAKQYLNFKLCGGKLSFERSINAGQTNVLQVPEIYLSLMPALTNTQITAFGANKLLGSQIDNCLKVQVLNFDSNAVSRYYPFKGIIMGQNAEISGGNGVMLSTNMTYLPSWYLVMGATGDPKTTAATSESLKVGVVRICFYVKFYNKIQTAP